MGGTKYLLQKGQVAKPLQGHKPTGQLGDTLDAELCHSPSSPLVRERRILGWAKQLPCPAPSCPRPIRTASMSA